MEAAGISTSSGTDDGDGLWYRATFKNELCTANHGTPWGVFVIRSIQQLSGTPWLRTFCISNILTARRAVKGASAIRTVIVSSRIDPDKWHGLESTTPNPRTFAAATHAVLETAAAIPAKSNAVHSAAPTGTCSAADRNEKPADELAEIAGDATATVA